MKRSGLHIKKPPDPDRKKVDDDDEDEEDEEYRDEYDWKKTDNVTTFLKSSQTFNPVFQVCTRFCELAFISLQPISFI